LGSQDRNVVFTEPEIPRGFQGVKPGRQMAAEKKLPSFVVHRGSPSSHLRPLGGRNRLPKRLGVEWAVTKIAFAAFVRDWNVFRGFGGRCGFDLVEFLVKKADLQVRCKATDDEIAEVILGR
jgi:hypothetical protein